MALIKCTECGVEVSDKAEKCPKCAYPIAPKKGYEPTQVIEQTSKSLKKRQLYAGGTAVLGMILVFISPAIGALFLIGGIIWSIVIRYQIWWHHK